jgi:hypothetical protein
MTPKNKITFYTLGEEMLSIDKNGFYVRGKKVKQDDNEAEKVYNAFKEFLTWSQITKHN